jgi:UDP-N-acetylmuramoyl-tripeptide--D-alanyl-D-alanine ligase
MTRWVGGLSGFRRRILVAGEMLELGADASALHAACGRVAAEAGMDLVIGVGGEARALLGGAGQAGLEPRQLLYADTADAASALLLERVGEGDVVLVKGSRGVGLEAVSQALGSAFEVVEG